MMHEKVAKLETMPGKFTEWPSSIHWLNQLANTKQDWLVEVDRFPGGKKNIGGVDKMTWT